MLKTKSTEQMSISATINGEKVEKSVEPRKLLSDFLREDCGLTGTHVGCEHGVCGACTVLVEGTAIRSCLMFAVQTDGMDIQTVEGLKKHKCGPPLQEAFSECHGLQCGFCTPGILMSSIEFLETHSNPGSQEINEMLSGHMCRCTGYKGITEAIQKVSNRNKA